MNTVHDTTNAAKDKAAEVGSQVSDKAKSQVDTRTTQAGDQLQDKAEGLHQMGDQLRDSGQDAFAQLADKIAGLTEDVAKYLREADGDSLFADVERIARRQPWAVAAGGLFLGFAASRIVKAGTDRRESTGSIGRYSTAAGSDDIDLTRGYATGTSAGLGSGFDSDYATGTTAGSASSYEPLGDDFSTTVPDTDAPLGDPLSYPPSSTQTGPSTGSYTDGNR